MGKHLNNDHPTTSEQRREKMLGDVHLAVCGDEDIGVAGLVQEMRELKEWRRKLDIRVATISGGVSAVIFIAKLLIVGH